MNFKSSKLLETLEATIRAARVSIKTSSEKLSDLFDYVCQSGIDFKKWSEKERDNFLKYIESELFEQHLDQFARNINLDFEKAASSIEADLLSSKLRKARIGVKLKLILEKCGSNTAQASVAGTFAGSGFGPHGSLIGMLSCGSLMVIYYAANWYGVVWDGSPVGSELPS